MENEIELKCPKCGGTNWKVHRTYKVYCVGCGNHIEGFELHDFLNSTGW